VAQEVEHRGIRKRFVDARYATTEERERLVNALPRRSG
jgi:hypothetical protein